MGEEIKTDLNNLGLGLVLLGQGLFKIFIVLLLQLLSGLEKVPSNGVGVR